MPDTADLDLKSLRAFIRVAEAGSISQAAIALGLTQSFLSRIVSGLERRLGNALFYRTGRGVALTEVGEEVLPRARLIVLDCEQLQSEIRGRGSEPAGLVTLALMPTLTASVAEPLFDVLRSSHPGIRLRMLEGFSASIAAWLAEGRADIGLVSRYGKGTSRHDEVLDTSHLMLIGRRETRPGRAVRFPELARMPLVLPAHPNGTRVAIDRVARRQGVVLQIAVEADSLEAQKALMARQGCRTIADPRTFGKEIDAGLLQAWPLGSPRIERRVVLSTTTHRSLSRVARVVSAAIRRLFEAQAVKGR